MKITKRQLKKIISEELNKVNEAEETDVAQIGLDINQAQDDLDKAVAILKSVLDTIETLGTHSSKPLGGNSLAEFETLQELMVDLVTTKSWLEKHKNARSWIER